MDRGKDFCKSTKSVLIALDSYYTHEYMCDLCYRSTLIEIKSQFVSKNNYLEVFNMTIEDLIDSIFKDKSWQRDNNSKIANKEFFNKPR